MSISQVARAMCYTNSNVYRLMRNKKMPFPVYREEGKQLYCLRSDVEQWLQNCDDDTEEWEQTHQERVHQAWIV
jgi:predicted DNA-binding transcriptional regulator AlpA